MTQKTLVVMVPSSGHAALKRRLAEEQFELRDAPYAVFQARGEGCVATLYRSGKLVVQGGSAEMFLARHTGLGIGDVLPPKGKKARPDDDEVREFSTPLVGSDEAGKGDYFGPLVVAAVRLTPEQARDLADLGVDDSKTLTDMKALALGAALRKRVDHAVHYLDPPDYNKAYSKWKNLNPLLADLHARAIREVALPDDQVLVDRFANPRVMEKALGSTPVILRQAEKAERNVAVAAASVLARQEFLLRLKELSDRFGVELRKGGGEPVIHSGVAFVRENGMGALSRVAKLHFKNTAKIEAAVARR